jgi:biotin carboxyl carrier protein
MEFELILDKSKYRVQVEAVEGGVKRIVVNGNQFDVGVVSDKSGTADEKNVKIADQNYKMKLLKHKQELGRAQFELQVNDKFASIEALMSAVQSQRIVQDSSDNIAASAMRNDRKKIKKTDDKGSPVSTKGGIYAPMPGRLVALKVKEGEGVKAGQVVAILEAMKMENELKATSTGKVKKINYKPGENVSQDKPIMIIE